MKNILIIRALVHKFSMKKIISEVYSFLNYWTLIDLDICAYILLI